MKRFLALAALATAGCASTPVSMSRVVAPEPADAYRCAVAQLNILDYLIEDGNADVGFVRGRKQTSGLGTQIMTGNTYHDVLTASVFEDPATGQTHLRVVVSRIADEDASLAGALGEGGQQGEATLAPSGSGIADGQRVLDACAAMSGAQPESEAGDPLAVRG